jgi:hypothetical protein
MLLYTVSGYTPTLQPESLAAYHEARDAFFAEDTAVNQQRVTNQIKAWREICQDAFNQVLEALT